MKKILLFLFALSITNSALAQGTQLHTGVPVYHLSQKIGIGTSNPAYLLDVNGLSNFSGNMQIGSTSSHSLWIGSNVASQGSAKVSNGRFEGYWGGESFPRMQFHRDIGGSGLGGIGLGSGGSAIDTKLYRSATNTLMTDGNFHISGTVGIGTTSPTHKLSVDGIIKAQGTDGRLMLENPSVNTSIYLRNRGASGERKLEILYGPTVKYVMDNDGNVGIGTTSPTEKLAVDGTILTKKIRVSAAGTDWPDYVFEPNFKLRTLTELEEYLQTNKHLPEVPSAKEVQANGLDLGKMDATLLKKVEELTLYLIEVNKTLEAQGEKIKVLVEENKKLSEEVKSKR